MILWIPYLGLLVLDPEGKRIQIAVDYSHGHIWPYEIDLTLRVISEGDTIILAMVFGSVIYCKYFLFVIKC